MSFWHNIETVSEMGRAYPWVLWSEVAVAFVLAVTLPDTRPRMRAAVLLLLVSFLGMLVRTSLLPYETGKAASFGFQSVHFLSHALLMFGTIQIGGTLLFRVLLPRVGLAPTPILRDVLFGLAYLAAILLQGRHGMNLSSLIATSAVLTAIIGFSLQETVSNVMGGVAIQVDRSVAVGDWVRVGEVEGRVLETHWRHTAVETRDWDTVIIPNSVLMKSAVTVLGRRAGQPKRRRVPILFNVAFRHSPDDVIGAVHQAFRGIAITDVAADPQPSCVLSEIRESYGSYTLFYWTADIARIPATSSEVRRRIIVALRRAGLDLAIPSQHVQLSLEGVGHGEVMLGGARPLGGVGPNGGASAPERAETS